MTVSEMATGKTYRLLDDAYAVTLTPTGHAINEGWLPAGTTLCLVTRKSSRPGYAEAHAIYHGIECHADGLATTEIVQTSEARVEAIG